MAKRKKTSEQKWRERYSKASSRLRQQIGRLEQRYPESVALEEGRREDWGGLKTLPKNYSLDELKRLTKYAEKTLKSGLYSLQRHRRAYANAQRTLQEDYGLTLDREQLGAYFRFRSDLKAKGLASLPYGKTGSLFQRAKKKGMSRDDLLKNINRWSKEYERLQKEGKEDTFNPKLKTGSIEFADKG